MSTTAATTSADAHGHAPEEEYRPPSPLAQMLFDLKDLQSVLFRTLYYTFRGKPNRRHVFEQMFHIGNQSMFFMTVTMAFIGAIIAFQMGLQVKRIIPDMTMVGAMYLKLLLRDLAASVGAMPLATRVGAGIAAEIGSMVVTDQTDALRMCAADPIEYLVVPRFIASVVMGTVVLLLGGMVAYFSGGVVLNVLYDVHWSTYMNFNQITWGDCALGFLKCLSYGGCIAVVSSQRGLRTFGGSEGVGIATTEAVVGSLFSIIMLNFFLSGLGYFIFPA